MKQLWRVSPSAVSKSSGPEGCERKVALGWVTPRGEETEKQLFGQELHTVQQDYLTQGKAHDRTTRAGKMAMAGLPYMPGPGTGFVEGKSEIRISGINYVTFVDYAGPSDLIPGAPPGMPATIDHKTSSNPSQYGLWGDEAFLNDPQALTYAVRPLIKDPTAQQVFNRWIYYDTRRKAVAIPSDSVMRRADVIERFGAIVHPAAVRLIVLQNECAAAAPKDASDEVKLAWANSVPANTNACEKYGGCEYFKSSVCKLTVMEKMTACLSGLDDAKIIKEKPAAVAVVTPAASAAVVEDLMSGADDLFAKLTAGLPVGAKSPAVANTVKVPAAAAPKGVSGVDALAALQAATKAKAAPVQAVVTAQADPINPPEKPQILPPAKGQDLVSHLVSALQAPPTVAQATDGIETALTAKPKAPSSPPKAQTKPPAVTKAESKAKLDVLLAEPTDEEIGRVVRWLVRSLVR